MPTLMSNGHNLDADKNAFNLETCARPNILSLKPYRCARDDYTTGILLDANENAHGPSLPPSITTSSSTTSSSPEETYITGLNRYPDPHQIALKQLICNLRNSQTDPVGTLTPPNLFCGVGSDEAIDAVMRVFCKPGIDKLMICTPTYGMYKVSASINEVDVVDVPLVPLTWQIDTEKIVSTLKGDPTIKLLLLTSPGNPTARLISPSSIHDFLAKTRSFWNGVLVLDEAYIDFSGPDSSLCTVVPRYPNLVVLQTLSKAFGLAGIRLGIAFASTEIAQLLNCMKAPYNVSSPASALAMRALSPEGLAVMNHNINDLLRQRDYLVESLQQAKKTRKQGLPGIGDIIGGLDANFILVRIVNGKGEPDNSIAEQLYTTLAETMGVVVRFRGNETGCKGALRITVGTKDEMQTLLLRLQEWQNS